MNIIINQLQKNFGPKMAVDIENYSIQSGDMLGLVGNNGAGKTTLFRLMLDLLKADGGSVHIENIDVSRSEEWKNITGAFIDEGFLIDYLTPEEYFYFVGKMYGLTKEEVDKYLNQIKEIGKKLIHTKGYTDVINYKQVIQKYLKSVVEYAYEIDKKDSFWNQNYFRTVNVVNEKLESITRDFFNDEKENIDMASQIDEINGLLIDLYL